MLTENYFFVAARTVRFARFTVFVVLKGVQGGAGGLTAGPAFKRIMSYLLRHYAVPPTDASASPYETTWGTERAR